MEQKCANCGNGKWRDGITAITDTCIKCHYVDKGALIPQPSNWKPKEQTNADRIRAMSDEELAEFLCGVYDDDNCGVYQDECGKFINGTIIMDYDEDSILEWLKQPAEGE